MIVLVAVLYGGDFEDGMSAYMKKDYKKAAGPLQKAANQGYAGAQYILATLYYQGKGVKKDKIKAAKLFQKAADQEILFAQVSLAKMYYQGEGVKQNYKKAVELFQKAADRGQVNAQAMLAKMYYQGEGVKQNYKKAYELWMKAAKQGDTSAQDNLDSLCKESPRACKQFVSENINADNFTACDNQADAMCFLNGTDFYYEKNYLEAMKYFKKTCDNGYMDGCNAMAMLYEEGKGVKQDKIKAYQLYLKAAQKGNKVAQDSLDSLCKKSPWACK